MKLTIGNIHSIISSNCSAVFSEFVKVEELGKDDSIDVLNSIAKVGSIAMFNKFMSNIESIDITHIEKALVIALVNKKHEFVNSTINALSDDSIDRLVHYPDFGAEKFRLAEMLIEKRNKRIRDAEEENEYY